MPKADAESDAQQVKLPADQAAEKVAEPARAERKGAADTTSQPSGKMAEKQAQGASKKAADSITKKTVSMGATVSADQNGLAKEQPTVADQAKPVTTVLKLNLATAALVPIVTLGLGLAVGVPVGQHMSGLGTAIETNYGKITSAQIYQQVKGTPGVQGAAQNLIMERVLMHDFPQAATDSKIQAQLKKLKKDPLSYNQALQSAGSEAALKASIKDSLLMTAAMKANTTVSAAKVRAAYRTYRPALSVAYVEINTKSLAQRYAQELANAKDYSQFKQMATNLKTADGKNVNTGMVPEFSSLDTNNQVPAEVLKATKDLQVGSMSKLIKTGDNKYTVLYLRAVKPKGSFAKEAKTIREKLKSNEQTNPTTRMKVMLKYAKRAHAKAVDSDYKSLVKTFNQSAEHANQAAALAANN